MSDLFEISAGGDILQEKFSKFKTPGYPYPVYANALANLGLYGYASYYKVDVPSITVTGRGDVGHAIARFEKFVPIVRLLTLIPKGIQNIKFFAEAINNTKIFMESTGVPQLTSPQLGQVKVFCPTLPEQQKIADFLSLVDERIEKQRQLVEVLKRYKRGVISRLLNELSDSEQIPLSTLVSSGVVKLGRGNVIPKYSKDEKRIYPVYSSSVQKNGLMGYFDSYMFDQELITWSIDGGGHFFYRKKHKFNVTNVCGIFEVDTEKYNYKFVAECLIEQHTRKHFDYQSKAHPSVIIEMYKLPVVPIHIQEKWSELFDLLDTQIMTSEKYLLCLGEFKQGLLQQMFI